MKISIVVSDKMTARGENNIVRLPAKGRRTLDIDRGKVLEIAGSELQIGLITSVKQAYKADISKAKKKKLPLNSVIFVSKNTATQLGRNRKLVHVSTSPRKCGIGSDPEYVVIDKRTGELVIARHCILETEHVGHDWSLLEIRPRPGKTVNDHIDAMGEAIMQIPDCIDMDRFDVRGKTVYADKTCGGHIHLGISSLLFDKFKELNIPEDAVYSILNYALVSGLAIPVECIDPNGHERRNMYGSPFSYRNLVNSLEFRVLSTKWTLYPDFAEMVLSAAHSIVAEVSARLYDACQSNSNAVSNKLSSIRHVTIGTAINRLRSVMGLVTSVELPTHTDISRLLINGTGNIVSATENISKPFLEDVIGARPARKLTTTVNKTYPDKIDTDVVNNWDRRKSITSTYK